MELNERIASVRRAAGLTQEQLGELVGVSRQAVSKWESGQAVPDALTIAALCQKLHVSADYILLGTDPEESSETKTTAPTHKFPDTCPCCGRSVEGTLCPICGYPLPTVPPRGPQYAIYTSGMVSSISAAETALQTYCGLSQEDAQALVLQCNGTNYATPVVLRRGLTDGAVQYLATHLQELFPGLTIALDEGESDEALVYKESAMALPPAAERGLGFWGVVGAVIVALLILSFL